MSKKQSEYDYSTLRDDSQRGFLNYTHIETVPTIIYDDPDEALRPVEPGETPDYWSVYGRCLPDRIGFRRAVWLADAKTPQEAEAFKQWLQIRFPHLRSN